MYIQYLFVKDYRCDRQTELFITSLPAHAPFTYTTVYYNSALSVMT